MYKKKSGIESLWSWFSDNWARELETWCSSLDVLHYHGSQEDRRNIRSAIVNGTLESEPDVILTTYGFSFPLFGNHKLKQNTLKTMINESAEYT